jgi:hypothetical protein
MKVARHFSAGYVPKSDESPGGTTEISSGKAFKRPHGTHCTSQTKPGTEVPGYLQSFLRNELK